MAETKVPSIPTPPTKADPATRKWMDAVKQALDVRLGHRGDKVDKAVTWRDLGQSGLATVGGVRTMGTYNLGPGIAVSPGTEVSYAIPPAPTTLAVAASVNNLYLSWAGIAFSNYSHTEIWRSATDNLGTAVLIGSSNYSLYADPADPGQTYYYWVRFVSTANVTGPYNQTAGTVGTTGQDPQAVLDMLQGQIDESLLAAALSTKIGDITTNTSGLAQEIADRVAAVAQEVTDRNAAVTAAIAQEVIDRNAAVNAAVAQEVIDRTAALDLAKGQLDGQVTVLNGLITATQQSIDEAAINAILQLEAVAAENTQNRADFLAFQDAILTIDPETGVISLAALAAYQDANDARVAIVEQDLNAAEASLTQKATITELNALTTRVGSAEISLNANTASIALKAEQAQVTGMDTRLGQAEIDIDAAEAAINLRATQAFADGLNSRLGQAELDIDAAEASILLKASQTEVTAISQSLSQAQIDIDAAEAAISLLATTTTAEGLNVRLTQAEIDINAAEAAITLKANQTETDSLNTRMNQAEIDIDAAEAAITLKASQTSVTNIDTRLGQAEIDIDAAEAAILLKASQSQVSDMDTRLGQAEIDIDAAEAAILLKASQTDLTDTELRVRTAEAVIDALDGQMTQRVSDLEFSGEGMLSGMLQQELTLVRMATAEQTLTATQNELVAEATARLALEAQFNTDIAATQALVTQESAARSDADSSLSSSIDLLNATFTSDLAATNAAVLSEATARANADTAEASRVDGLLATVNSDIAAANAAISSEATARAGADTAEASRVDGLLATVNQGLSDNAAAISSEATARADAVSAVASTVSTLSSTVDGHTASISEQSSTVDGIMAEKVLKLVGPNDHVAGMGLRADLTGSEIIFLADKFSILHPDADTVNGRLGFTQAVLNGIPTTVMDAANIINLTVTDAMITGLTADKITGGLISAEIEMNALAYTGGSMNINNQFLVDAQGNVTANAGTFGGSLNAATGTFEGSLTANAVNAVNTINLAGEAVTVPVTSFTRANMAGLGTGWSTIQTLTIPAPPAGKTYNVLIGFSFRLDWSVAGNDFFSFELWRDDDTEFTVMEGTNLPCPLGAGHLFVSATRTLSVSSAVVLTLRGKKGGQNVGTVTCGYRTINATTVKR